MELELYSKGIRIHDSVSFENKRPPLRLRAGLGSGLETMLHGIDDWRGDYLTVNIPIHGTFINIFIWQRIKYFPKKRKVYVLILYWELV